MSGGEIVGLTEKEIKILLNIIRLVGSNEEIEQIMNKLKLMCI